MMKKRICWVLFVCLCFTLGWAQSVRSYRQAEDSLTVVLSEGEIRLYPLADNAVRVKYVRQEPVLPDWVYVGNDKPAWSVKETGEEITLGLLGLEVRIDKEKERLLILRQKGNRYCRKKSGNWWLHRYRENLPGVPLSVFIRLLMKIFSDWDNFRTDN